MTCAFEGPACILLSVKMVLARMVFAKNQTNSIRQKLFCQDFGRHLKCSEGLEVEVLQSQDTFFCLMHQGTVFPDDISLPNDAKSAEPAKANNDEDEFDFATTLLNLTPSYDPDESLERNNHVRTIRRAPAKLSLLDGVYRSSYAAISLTVGLQVVCIIISQKGSGIFSSPGIITAYTGSIGASILVWVASGMLALTGASSYAELATAIPLNGGAQAYLQVSCCLLTLVLIFTANVVSFLIYGYICYEVKLCGHHCHYIW